MAVSKARKTSESSAAAMISDDLLFEILLRLPDSRSAVRCAIVSKRWLSLISHPEFISAFIHRHRRRHSRHNPDNSPCSSPYTLIYSYEDPIFYQFLHHDSTKPLITAKPSTSDLDFLPWPKDSTVIRASFDDLLLVSNADSSGYYYCVCNPVTRQWLALPKAPAKGKIFGLVCEAKNCAEERKLVAGSCNCSIRYKVCLIGFSYNYAAREYAFHATVFCSETGRWSQRPSILCFPGDQNYHKSHVAVSNGALHWLLWDHGRVTGIAAFDPFKDPRQARPVVMPEDFDRGSGSYMENTFIGVVRGRLRLSQLYTFRGVRGFLLKVWEYLDYDCVSSNSSSNSNNSSWLLVHDLVVRRPTAQKMYVTGFDPNNGGVVFFLHGLDILRCEISNATDCECQNVGEFPVTDEEGIRAKQLYYDSLSGFNIFNLVHPSWPTPLPALPAP